MPLWFRLPSYQREEYRPLHHSYIDTILGNSYWLSTE